MTGLIRADPERLEEYTASTSPTLAPARQAVEAYRRSVVAFNNAAEPNDLGTHLEDLSGALLEPLDGLDLLDELPAAFAAALRRLDGTFDSQAFARLVAAELLVPPPPAPGAEPDDDAVDRLRQWGAWVDKQRNRLSKLGVWFKDFPEALEFVVEDVTATVRRTVIVVEEATERAWRRGIITVDEWEILVRRWSVRIDFSALRRAAPALKKLGLLGDLAAGGFAAWEQWDQDADRTDLTPTERVLRAGLDGFGRGGVQFAIGAVSTLAAVPFLAAAVPSFGLSLIPAGSIIAAGVAAGEWVDPRAAARLDQAYDSSFGSGLIQGIADSVDAVGRGVRDVDRWSTEQITAGYEAARQDLADAWDELMDSDEGWDEHLWTP